MIHIDKDTVQIEEDSEIELFLDVAFVISALPDLIEQSQISDVFEKISKDNLVCEKERNNSQKIITLLERIKKSATELRENFEEIANLYQEDSDD